jgi:hypothetical protein
MVRSRLKNSGTAEEPRPHFLTSTGTPAANDALQLIEKTALANANRPTLIAELENLRQIIGGSLYKQASNSADRNAVSAIKAALDDFMDQVLPLGTLKAARAAKRASSQAFDGSGKIPGEKQLQKARTLAADLAADDVGTNQKSIDQILGKGGLNSANVSAIKHLKSIAPNTEGLIKEAAVLRAIYGSANARARKAGAQKMLGNLQEAIDGKGKEIMSELFNDGEMVVFRALRDDIADLVLPSNVANPSGSSAGFAEILRKYARSIPMLSVVFAGLGEPIAALAAKGIGAGAAEGGVSGAVKRALGGYHPARPPGVSGGLIGPAVSESPGVVESGVEAINEIGRY